MDAVEYVKTLCRLCKNCSECPLRNKEDGSCIVNRSEHAEKAVQIVEQWAKDHPLKTRQSEFLKIFPETAVRDGVIFLCPKLTCQTLAGTDSISWCKRNDCAKCRREYWLAEVTDND